MWTPLLRRLIDSPRLARRLALVTSDTVAVAIALWAAFSLRFGQLWPQMLEQVKWLFPVAILVSLPVFHALRFYRSLIRYAGAEMLYAIVKAVTLSLLIIIAIWVFSHGDTVPRSSWFIYWFVLIGLIGGSRLLARDVLRSELMTRGDRQRVAIYGAGAAGVQLATALRHSTEFRPVVFVDDKRDLRGSEINGLRVYSPSRLKKLVQQREIDGILLAMPSVSSGRRRQILDALAPLPVQVLAMPGLPELASGAKRIDELREVDVEDILGRDPVGPRGSLLERCVRGKAVLVSGAGGSIGSELCRQIIQHAPRLLVLFEHSEYALYAIERELNATLRAKGVNVEIVPILGSVLHRQRVQRVMQAFGVETVYHAAAYKHVPIVEHNPIEGIQNNIFGTLHVAQAAIAAGVETFVLISTDKAVRPTNVMGATKRFAELILQALAQEKSSTRFCMVRFGNVLASSGSVVPLFREQIRRGGPVTVTHPDIVRYFMTIPEAAQLVIQAGAMGEGGDVFVLDMGEPVRILDLAKRMIRLSGLEVRDEVHPHGDIEIVYTGLRPGEKLYEELLIGDHDAPTEHPMIMRAEEEQLAWPQIDAYLERLSVASRKYDWQDIRAVLKEAVRGYTPESDIVDWLWLARQREASLH